MSGNDMPPLWVYGEDGIEIPPRQPMVDLGNIIDINPDNFSLVDGDGCELEIKLDRKTMRKIKWLCLKSAIKWFFSRE